MLSLSEFHGSVVPTCYLDRDKLVEQWSSFYARQQKKNETGNSGKNLHLLEFLIFFLFELHELNN